MALKISAIDIKNFKSLAHAHLDVPDVLILHGPNGYGKTTVFDALELALTGKIWRIENSPALDGRRAYHDPAYCKDPSQPIKIQIALSGDSEDIVVSKVRSAMMSSSRSTRSNSPLAWDTFSTYMNGRDEDVNPKEVLARLQMGDAGGEGFHLFYYVQQEERAAYLKRSERDRLREISILFNTTKEEDIKKKGNCLGTRDHAKGGILADACLVTLR